MHHGLHHTQSLYALRLARHAAVEREREEAQAQLVARALNGYAGYEDYSRGFPGTGDTTGSDVGIAGGLSGQEGMNVVGPTESAIHPGLLFGNANNNNTSSNVNGNGNAGGLINNNNGTARNGQVSAESSTSAGVSARQTPAQSRSGSPLSSSTPGASSSGASGSSGTNVSGGPTRKAPQPSTTLSRPSSSLLLSKPFKCPTPGCTKSYKQANGLKYHVTHGQCSFTPPPELSSISELGLAMGVNLKLGPMGIEGLEGMSEKERREAEREAERRLKPFCCQVKPCTRRYKNMNGLRYHYQHSGEHGAIGLRMLASGRHDATRSQSAERSDEEDGGLEDRMKSEDGTTNGNVNGSMERGRKKERSGAGIGQTSSAPSTPGPSQRRTATGQFATPFPIQSQMHLQQQQQRMQNHQRSLSGTGTVNGTNSQPVSPLSQQFSVPTTPSTTSAFAYAGQMMNNLSSLTSLSSLSSSAAGLPGQPQQPQQQQQQQQAFASFAVQSQPASAYASPWGSRSGSPTSGTQWGQPQPQIQADVSMTS